MPRAYELYLRDILRGIERINLLLQEIDEAAFKSGDVRVDGILFNLMMIGEAVKNVPDAVREQMPEVRWRDIGRFRDQVAHHYFALDLGIVWEIVQVYLPVLRDQVKKLLEHLEQAGDTEGEQ